MVDKTLCIVAIALRVMGPRNVEKTTTFGLIARSVMNTLWKLFFCRSFSFAPWAFGRESLPSKPLDGSLLRPSLLAEHASVPHLLKAQLLIHAQRRGVVLHDLGLDQRQTLADELAEGLAQQKHGQASPPQ